MNDSLFFVSGPDGAPRDVILGPTLVRRTTVDRGVGPPFGSFDPLRDSQLA